MSTIQRNKHWINRLPHLYEIDDMIAFCKQHNNIYIYGCGEAQEWLLRYLDMCGMAIEGYVVTYDKKEQHCFAYREMPVIRLEELIDKKNVAVILGLPDCYHGEVVPLLREYEIPYFSLTEHSRLGIAEQIAPRNKNEMTFEISLADHCNLSCQMCDHFSQLSKPWLVDEQQFKSDIARMAEIFDHEIGAITLLGGEPTLHPKVNEFLMYTRNQFPNAEIILLTNGVLLTKWENLDGCNLWETLKEYDIKVTVTVYPIKLDYEEIERKATEYGVALKLSSDIHAVEATKQVKISDKHTMDLKGKVPKEHCVHCLYFNKFNVVKDGRYYMCPVEAHINILNECFDTNFEYKKGDYLDIYKVSDWKEFAEFGSKWIPFCRFCDQKKWGHASAWKVSTKSINEYI